MTIDLAGQETLFADSQHDIPPALPYLAVAPAAYRSALAGDDYNWLVRVLPPPVPLLCPRCRHAMRLPSVELLWQCARCEDRPTPCRAIHPP